MYYLLIYSLLVYLSRMLLLSSQSFLANLLVVILSFISFYLMYKQYLESFDGKYNFKLYHQDLLAKENAHKLYTSKFDVNIKKWLFLFYVYNVSSIFTGLLANWSFYIVSILTLTFMLIIFLPILIESWHGLKKVSFLEFIRYVFLANFALFLINIANSLFFEFIGFNMTESLNQALIIELLSKNFYRVTFEATIMAAIYEELIFRGLFFRNLVNKNKVLAYLTTFITFGLPHIIIGLFNNGLSELMFLPVYGLMGVVFAIIYQKTDSIYTAMSAHYINNLISILLIFLFVC